MDGAHDPLHGEWRELRSDCDFQSKTLCWYEVEQIHPSHPQNQRPALFQGHGTRVGEQSHLQARNMKYYCDIQEAEQFGKLLWATGLHHQVDACDEIIFVSDGAVWIWNLVQKYFPNAVQIVESGRCASYHWFHASEYLTPIAEAAFGVNSPQAHEWLTQVRTELWDGRIQDVIQSCRSLLSHTAAHPWIVKAIT